MAITRRPSPAAGSLSALTPEQEAAILGAAKGDTSIIPPTPPAPTPKEDPKESDGNQPETDNDQGKQGKAKHEGSRKSREPKAKEFDLSSLLSKKPKTVPIEIPTELHALATECAANHKPKIPLYQYILIALAEKVMKDREGKEKDS